MHGVRHFQNITVENLYKLCVLGFIIIGRCQPGLHGNWALSADTL